MYTLGYLTLINIVPNLIIYFFQDRLLQTLVPKRKRNPSRFIWYTLLCCVTYFAVSWITLHDIQTRHYLMFTPLFMLVVQGSAIVLILIQHIYFSELPRRVIFFIGMLVAMGTNFLTMVISTITQTVMMYTATELYEASFIFRQVGNILDYILMTVILWLFLKFFTKTRLFRVFRKILHSVNLTFAVGIIYFIMDLLLSNYLNQVDRSTNGFYVIYWVASYAILFIFNCYLFWQFRREQRLKETEALILQQNTYVARLEKIQQELRKMHHDYKNVAAGAYAQVAAGDTQAAKHYISEKLLKMDADIQVSIQQLNQLVNLQIMELKSLLMMKIIEAESAGVQLTIEIQGVIQSVDMETSDLLRCIGILVDNAIEAAAAEEKKEVTLLLFKEKELTMVVRNPISDSVDLQKMWQRGFSTKGTDRGLGLSNLKDVLRRYPKIVLETQIQDNQLLQGLHFSK